MNMNVEKLMEHLTPWLNQANWSSGLSDQDTINFNHTLELVFETFGTSITVENFKDAILLYGERNKSNIQIELRECFAEKFAQRAENINDYLHDNS